MAGIEENVALSGDWMAPSPSPRTFFSAMLSEDFGPRSAAMESGRNNQEPFFLRPQEERLMENSEAMEGTPPSPATLSSFSEQKANLRGGLGERIAARAGFNAPRLNTESIRTSDLSLDSNVKSPFWTIPPGLSPTTLLDSPVFLSNSLIKELTISKQTVGFTRASDHELQVQPSPTTGKMPFFTSDDIISSSLMSEASNRSKDHLFSSINSPPFAFKPGDDMRPPLVLGAMAPATHPQPSFPAEAPVQSSSLNSHSAELSKPPSKGHGDFSPDRRFFDSINDGNKHSPPLGERFDEEGEQRATGESVVPNNSGAPSDDGYNWRKYGQKQVKGSEYPRSYYKCTHPNCQVKKKVERSYEGHITEIIYKGAHSHPKPSPNRCNTMQKDANEQPQSSDADLLWTSLQKGASDWRNDNPEVTSTASVGPEYVNQSTSLQPQNGSHYEPGDAVDVSSTFSNDDDEEDRGTHGSASIGHDGEGDESESKRRKIEVYASEMSGASRAIREPRVVVQTTSEVDILDDGYRWRKYGQKVVKGNPNPRSYYKCTAAGCTVRKHVERASHDLKSVITTYEGKHNHDVPAARNNSHMNAPSSGSVAAQAAATGIQNHGHRQEPSQAHPGMARFDRPPQLGPFGLAGRQQVGPPLPAPHGFSYSMNHPPTLPNLALPAVGHSGQVKLPVLPFHPYMGQHRQGEEMGFGMIPKGEMKVEPMTEAVYHQIMSGLPLGPHV